MFGFFQTFSRILYTFMDIKCYRVIKKMKKHKTKILLIASVIVIIVLAEMAILLMPGIVKASENTDEEIETPEDPVEEDENTETEPHGTVSVTGEARIEYEPNILKIILKIITKDMESVEKARDQAAVIIDNVIKSLRKIGITDENIETTSYNIEAKYESERVNGVYKKVFRGYFVTVRMKITLKDFGKAGEVIDASVDSGAFVDSINFELSWAKRNEIKTQLYAEAAKDAKLKAETVVKALGDKLGDVKSVNINNYIYRPWNYYKGEINFDGYNYSSVGVSPPTTIMPSDLTLTVNVNAVFEIL